MPHSDRNFIDANLFQLSESQNIVAEICESIAKTVGAQGIELIPHTAASLKTLSELAPEAVKALTTNLQFYQSIIASASGLPGVDGEINLLNQAFSKLGASPFDDHWKSKIREGLLIEIYSLEMTQLYRNFEFFKHCSYDLLTLVTNTWEELYERPAFATTALINRATEILKTQLNTTPYNLPQHVLKERGREDRIFLVKMLSLTPLFRPEANAGFTPPSFFLHFVESSLVANGTTASNTRIF